MGVMDDPDPAVVRQCDRGGEHGRLAKQRLGPPAADRHPVLGRDLHVGVRRILAQRAPGDRNRLQMRRRLQRLAPQRSAGDEADRTGAMIAGRHEVANRQILHQNPPGWRVDPGARGKAEDDAALEGDDAQRFVRMVQLIIGRAFFPQAEAYIRGRRVVEIASDFDVGRVAEVPVAERVARIEAVSEQAGEADKLDDED